jgi:hypothetical protein
MEKSMAPRIKRTLAMTARAACVTIVALFSSPGHAAEVHVLSAAAMQSVFKEIRDEFQRTTGYRLVLHYGTIGAVNEWTMGRRGSGPDYQLVAIDALARLPGKNPGR